MDGFAPLPEPPYYAVIFSSRRTEGDHGYAAMSERMVEMALAQPGCLAVERAYAGPARATPTRVDRCERVEA